MAAVLIQAGRASATPAAPAIAFPAPGALVTASFVTVEGNADPGTRVTISVNTGGSLATTADASGHFSIGRQFADATHTLTAVARDTAGVDSAVSAPVTFTVDTQTPSPPQITTPSHGSATNQTTVTISGSAEPSSRVDVYEGSTIASITAFADGTFRASVTFTVGDHTISARASDAAGHTSGLSGDVSFTVDRDPPAAPVITSPQESAVVAPGAAVLEGTAEPFATVDIFRGTIVIAITAAGVDGTWSVSLPVVNGFVHVAARARDTAGNAGPMSPVRNFVVDGTAPNVSFATQEGTIFLPTDSTMLEGNVTDDWGLRAVTLDFYDVSGRATTTAIAVCDCYQKRTATWKSVPHLLPGRYIVRAYAHDAVGNKSETRSISIITVSL